MSVLSATRDLVPALQDTPAAGQWLLLGATAAALLWLTLARRRVPAGRPARRRDPARKPSGLLLATVALALALVGAAADALLPSPGGQVPVPAGPQAPPGEPGGSSRDAPGAGATPEPPDTAGAGPPAAAGTGPLGGATPGSGAGPDASGPPAAPSGPKAAPPDRPAGEEWEITYQPDLSPEAAAVMARSAADRNPGTGPPLVVVGAGDVVLESLDPESGTAVLLNRSGHAVSLTGWSFFSPGSGLWRELPAGSLILPGDRLEVEAPRGRADVVLYDAEGTPMPRAETRG